MTSDKSNFIFAHFSTVNIPQGTDPLTLEIYAQLLDYYTTELEIEHSIQKLSNYLKTVPVVTQPTFTTDNTHSHGIHG